MLIDIAHICDLIEEVELSQNLILSFGDFRWISVTRPLRRMMPCSSVLPSLWSQTRLEDGRSASRAVLLLARYSQPLLSPWSTRLRPLHLLRPRA